MPTSRVGLVATLSTQNSIHLLSTHFASVTIEIFLSRYLFIYCAWHAPIFPDSKFCILLTCKNIQKSFMNCRQSKKLVCVLPCTKLSWMKTAKEVRTVCVLGSVIFYTRVVYTLQGTGHVLPHTTQAGSLTISWLPATSLCSNLDQGNIVSRYLSNWIPIILFIFDKGKSFSSMSHFLFIIKW